MGGRQIWRNILNRQRYVANINQLREPNANDNLGIKLTSALHRSIQRQINQDPSLSEHSTIHFALQSDAFTQAFQCVAITVREFQDGSERLDTYLQALAQKLNSNQEFSPDDTFTMGTSFIRTPGPGGKNSKNIPRDTRPSESSSHIKGLS